MGETPTALAAIEFTGASAYHSLQVTLRKQTAHSVVAGDVHFFARRNQHDDLQ
jgi:hypothetical protein